MPLRIGNIAFDCDDVRKVAQFWAAALGRSLDPASSPAFASLGGSDPDRVEPAWYFQKVPEQKKAKNRVHLDLVDPELSIERLWLWVRQSLPNTRSGAVSTGGQSCRIRKATSSA